METSTAPGPPKGRVLDIQHFCTHDGPGIRTTVFLKGCSLRCKWCCNPESISPRPELAYDAKKCIGQSACRRCLAACPEQAIDVAADGKVRVDWDRCTDCGTCVPVCPSRALHEFGGQMTVEEVLADVEQDAAFYRESGGGITLSGGECLRQPEFCAALLAQARRRGMTTAIETAGYVPWRAFAQVLPYVDTVLHDFKVSDPGRHREWVGADNARIHENYRRAYEAFPDTQFIARTPLVPGVNDDERHVRAVLAFIRPHRNVIDYELLPYHRYGESKYQFLGRVYDLRDFAAPAAESLARLRAIIDQAFGRGGAPK
ncbi:MAG: glycyl-radical enzyme activating protein [Burkholderiales bacterium]|nr:glycyl-radical enzyme activating protein [Burkholderiales bacterium]